MEVRCKKVIVTCLSSLSLWEKWCPSAGVVLSFHGQPWVWGDISSNDFVPRVSRSPPAGGFFTFGSWCAAVSGGFNSFERLFSRLVLPVLPWQNQRANHCWYGTFECEYAMWSDPLSETANNQWVVCDPRNLWPTSKVCFAQSSGKVANKDVTTTFLVTTHKLRHISTSTIWVGLNDKQYLVDHTCLWSSKLSQPQPLQLRYNESAIWFHNYDTHQWH